MQAPNSTTFRPFPTLHAQVLYVYARHLRSKLMLALDGHHGPLPESVTEVFRTNVAALGDLMAVLGVHELNGGDRAPRSRPSQQPRGLLTLREREILRLVCAGYTNAEIANQLNYGVGTIKAHVRAILEKMHVSDRTEAAVAAVKRGLI